MPGHDGKYFGRFADDDSVRGGMPKGDDSGLHTLTDAGIPGRRGTYQANRNLTALQSLGGWKLSRWSCGMPPPMSKRAHTIDRLPWENTGDATQPKKTLNMINVLTRGLGSLHTGGVAGSIPASPTIFPKWFQSVKGRPSLFPRSSTRNRT